MVKPRVLFVDDEPRIVRLLEMLFRHDYEIFTATSGAEALVIVENERPHVIVSDQRMPKMTGIELLSRVREQSPNTVRILLTGYSDLVAIIGAVNEGEVYRFLNKPWDDDALAQAISEAAEIAVAAESGGFDETWTEDSETFALSKAARTLAIDGVGKDGHELLEIFTEDDHVLSARSLAEAEAQLAHHNVGVIVAEYESTSEEAMALCALVRENYPHTTVVLLAYATDSEMIVRLINEGQIYRFAMCPVAPNVFRLAMAAAMKEHHRRLARAHHAKILRKENVPEALTETADGNLAQGIKKSLGRFTKVW
jgi:response regulator RpfG family c-di-GMP phosphodiesterase